jgi:hypothetical protein
MSEETSNAAIATLVLRLTEVVSKQKEELELLRANLEVLAHSTARNVEKMNGRFERAEKAITEDHPRIISERFESTDTRIDETFARLSQVDSRLSHLDEALTAVREKTTNEDRYKSALLELAGRPLKINSSLLEVLRD